MSNISVNAENQPTNENLYTTAWNYFSLLSGQRMQMFEFFITLEVFLSGAFITLISLKNRLDWAETVVAGLVSLIAILFGLLDHRTKTMIHCCEETMIQFETQINQKEEYRPISLVNSCRKAKLTYTKLIRFLQIVFFFFFFCGVLFV